MLMELINRTPFPSLTFSARDQHCQPSHVLVMRATYDIKPDGTLELSEKQVPIVLADEYHGEPNRSCFRQESDLVPYKPRCDVIRIRRVTVISKYTMALDGFPITSSFVFGQIEEKQLHTRFIGNFNRQSKSRR